VFAAQQENGAVRPGEDPFAQRQEPLLGLGAPVHLLHARAELHLVVKTELLGEPVQIVEVLLVGPVSTFEKERQ